ncbi:NAD(P)-binding protein, partial [bacterium]|nr:NAD(P)-binding protein [bacterium]
MYVTEVNNSYRVLIIGGGIAGMAASLELARNDIPSVLIEKSTTIGGHSLEYCCKASESCNSCSACIVKKY